MLIEFGATAANKSPPQFQLKIPAVTSPSPPPYCSCPSVTMDHQQFWHSSPVCSTHPYEYAGQLSPLACRMNPGLGGREKQRWHIRKNILDTKKQLFEIMGRVFFLLKTLKKVCKCGGLLCWWGKHCFLWFAATSAALLETKNTKTNPKKSDFKLGYNTFVC